MSSISVSKTINAPIGKVFTVFSDIEKAQERIEGIKKIEILSKQKSGVGLKWRETRVMFGKEATEVMEIAALDKNKSYEVLAESHGTNYSSVYNFHEKGKTTEVHLVFTATPVSMGAKVMGLFSFFFKGSVKKAFEKDMDELKAVCEAK